MPTKEELRSRFNDLQKRAEHIGRGGDREYSEAVNRTVNGKGGNDELRSIHREMKKIIRLENEMNRR